MYAPIRASVLLAAALGSGLAAAQGFDVPRQQAFVEAMSRHEAFDAAAIRKLLDQAEYRQDIVDAISRPAEAKPWHRYRPIFLGEARIEAGVEFWRQHEALLRKVAEQYRVEPEIIVAIVGVETFYGRHKGKHRVLDALATLAFAYPPRSDFFQRELEQYFLLTREEGLDPLTLTGSYAGAMGMPQFISSSYRHYAVDGDGDGRRDLLENTADALSSVANYFRAHGWRHGDPIAYPAKADGSADWHALIDGDLKPSRRFDELASAGVRVEHTVEPARTVKLLALEQPDRDELWVGFHNFYVITRYNRSPLYAMAVYQLSQAIKNRYEVET